MSDRTWTRVTHRVLYVERIVDGDTVDVLLKVGNGPLAAVRQARLRLYGIDAPETRTRDADEKERGYRARDRLEDLAPVGGRYRNLYATIHNVGKFGRFVATLKWTGVERTINQILLDEGLVEPYGEKG